MPDKLIYEFKIDGEYTPENIPMQRLSQYMSDMAALLGEGESVHFQALKNGSAILAAAIDQPAIRNVMQRIASIEQGDMPDDLQKAYESLDKRLAHDNATGSLKSYLGEDRVGATVVRFLGRARPVPPDFGVIRQQGSLDGILLSIGNREISAREAHVILQDRNRTHTGINISQKLAKSIAKHLYAHVRLHGAGSWKRDEKGDWKLQRFRVDSFEVLNDATLREALQDVRDVQGSGWLDIGDPNALLEYWRSESDERPH